MTIETKYKIGDEVWVVAVNQVLMREVVKVRIVGINEKYGYEVTSDTWLKRGLFEEKRLFPTKEELIKSL